MSLLSCVITSSSDPRYRDLLDKYNRRIIVFKFFLYYIKTSPYDPMWLIFYSTINYYCPPIDASVALIECVLLSNKPNMSYNVLYKKYLDRNVHKIYLTFIIGVPPVAITRCFCLQTLNM